MDTQFAKLYSPGCAKSSSLSANSLKLRILAQYSLSIIIKTFKSSEAGCQSGGPLLVRSPIEVGEALITPRCLVSK